MEKYGLIGFPLGHSFSKDFFAYKFQQEGIDATYDNYEIEQASNLRKIVMQEPALRGVNVTIPHKQAVIPLLDEMSEEAQAIGAVNVIRVTRNAQEDVRLKGYNSDTIGFTNSLKPLLKPCHTKALVLGTGGASKAVCYSLEQLGIAWKYVSRSAHEGMFTYQELTPEIMQEYKLIVNCSPLGMFPHTDTCPDIPYESLTSEHMLYDLVYNPTHTLFLKKGEERGAAIKNGLEMLHLQALASWDFWHEN